MINNWQLTNTDRQTTAMTMTITEEDLNETVLQGKMSEKLCIKWNEFQDNISKIFGKLRADTDYTDVTLACEDGKQIGAHRVVLAASSDFFQKLFARTKHSHPMIYLRGMKSEDLAPIIDFVYFGEAKIYQENLDNFLSVANEFQIKGLMNQFGDVVREFETEKELPFKPVANSDNTQWIEETEQSQKCSKAGMEVVAVLSPLSCDIESQVKSMMEKSKYCVKNNNRGGRKKRLTSARYVERKAMPAQSNTTLKDLTWKTLVFYVTNVRKVTKQELISRDINRRIHKKLVCCNIGF